jgi:intein-encoded DNA endonuclease-like protein
MGDVNLSAGYVCGVLCSAGNVIWNEKHGNYLISLETMNEEFARLFSGRLNVVTGKIPRTGTHKRNSGGVVVHMNIVTLYGRGTIENLIKNWGFSFGTRRWAVPKIAWTDAVFRRGFITGFCDGNGSVSVSMGLDSGKVTKRRSVKLYSVNDSGLSDVRKLLETEGIRSLFYRAGKCFTISINGKTRLRLFMERLGFGITEKKRRLDEALLPPSLSRHEDGV